MTAVAQNIRVQLTDKLLNESRDSGVISQKTFNAIKKSNEFYTPFEVIEYMADNFKGIPGGKKSFNVATQNIIKPIKGTTKDIDEPLNAIVRKVFKVVNINERNKVAQKFINLRKLDPKMDELIVPFKEGTAVPRGFEKFSAFFDGDKKTFAIPSDVAEALKGLNAENMDLLTQMASIGTKILKTGATQLNLAFAVPNMVRDFQTAKLVNKTGFNFRDWTKGLASVLKRDTMFKAFEEEGASFAGFFTRQRRTLPVTPQELAGQSLSKKIITHLNPFKIIAKVAETSELSTRVGLFKRNLGKGLSATESAFEARNATIDFAKMGSKMKIINQWVPFINARSQGSFNIARVTLVPSSPKYNPARAAWLGASMITVPQVATYMWNTSQYPDVWDDIRQFEKDKNFMFISGREKDEEGKWVNVVKIPKGDFGRIVGNPVEAFLEFWRSKDPSDFDGVALKAISDFSPISFEREGKLSGGAVLSGVLPTVAKAGIESATGVNLYSGFPVVPRSLEGTSPREQFTKKTPKILVKIGQAFNVSPIKLDNAIGTIGGGLARQVVDPPFGIIKGVGRRFTGARGGERFEKDFELVTDITRDLKDESVQLKRRTIQLIDAARKQPDPESKKNFIQENILVDSKLTKEFVNLMKKGDEAPIFRFIRQLPIVGRVRYIQGKIIGMTSDEEKIDFIKEMLQKKILTEGVVEEVIRK